MSHFYDNEPSYSSDGNAWRTPDSEKNYLGSWSLGLGIVISSAAESFLGLSRSFEGCNPRRRQIVVRPLTEMREPLELSWGLLESVPP